MLFICRYCFDAADFTPLYALFRYFRYDAAAFRFIIFARALFFVYHRTLHKVTVTI